MAWTPPITFTNGVPLTKAQLDTYLRDNMLETAPSNATTAGRYFAVAAANQIAEREIGSAYFSASSNTTSTSYDNLEIGADLTGPLYTLTTGPLALVALSCRLTNNTVGSASFMSVEVSGASTIAAADSFAIEFQPIASNRPETRSYVGALTGLTPGVNTFTVKYRVSGGTGAFALRRLTVMPF